MNSITPTARIRHTSTAPKHQAPRQRWTAHGWLHTTGFNFVRMEWL